MVPDEELCAIDSVAAAGEERRDQIRNWLGSAHCSVAQSNGSAAGYGVLTHHFFGQPFIEMVMVGRDYGRQG